MKPVCEQVREAMHLALDDDGAAADLTPEAQQHVISCSECAAAWEELLAAERLLSGTGAALRPEPASPLAPLVMARIDREAPRVTRSPEADVTPRVPLRHGHFITLAAAAAAFLWLGNLNAPLPPPERTPRADPPAAQQLAFTLPTVRFSSPLATAAPALLDEAPPGLLALASSVRSTARMFEVPAHADAEAPSPISVLGVTPRGGPGS